MTSVIDQEAFGSGLDDGSEKLAGDIQLRTYSSFMSQYSQQLTDLGAALTTKDNASCDKQLDPISLETSPNECTSLLSLVNTDNKVLNKVIIALSALCLEVEYLKKEAEEDFFDPLLFYGEGIELQKEDGSRQNQIGRMLPTLQKLSCFISRSREVLKHMVLQLAALHNKSMPKVMDVSQVHFTTVFECIGVLLRIMITLDGIVSANTTLKDDWSQYKMILKSVNQDPAKYETTDEKLKPFAKMLGKIEKQILSGQILQYCWAQNFDDTGIPVTKNTLFAEEFLYNIKKIFANLDN